MTTIVTRAGKGSVLSHAEMDANLNNLNNDKSETTHTHTGVYQPASVNLDEYAAVNPTAAGLALLDDATASDQLTTLGVSTYMKGLLDDADEATLKASINLEIGTDVQAYDVDTAKLNVDQTWTGAQRSTPVTDADANFDMTAGNDFLWTPAGADTLEFSNEVQGQRGCILLNNSSGYTISLGSEIDADAGCAASLTAAGKYWISYWCYDGTNVAISYTKALV